MRHALPLLALILTAPKVFAQTPATSLHFEVASIKPADPDARGSSIMTDRLGGLSVTNVPLRNIITMAYGIRDFQLSGGPGWIGTDRYNIVAKPERTPAAPPENPDERTMTDDQRKTRDDQWKDRVRSLLSDRFGLVVHTETKEQPVYVLTVAKNGPKLKVATNPGLEQGVRGGRGRSQGMAAPISMLVNTLSSATGRPVVDKTGLTEKYDYVLEWTPDLAAAESTDSAPSTSGPTIFTALQEQLGLRLESSKGPVVTIVIDRVDRPSAN